MMGSRSLVPAYDEAAGLRRARGGGGDVFYAELQDAAFVGVEHRHSQMLPGDCLATLRDAAQVRVYESADCVVVLVVGQVKGELLLEIVDPHPGGDLDGPGA